MPTYLYTCLNGQADKIEVHYAYNRSRNHVTIRNGENVFIVNKEQSVFSKFEVTENTPITYEVPTIPLAVSNYKDAIDKVKRAETLYGVKVEIDEKELEKIDKPCFILLTIN